MGCYSHGPVYIGPWLRPLCVFLPTSFSLCLSVAVRDYFFFPLGLTSTTSLVLCSVGGWKNGLGVTMSKRFRQAWFVYLFVFGCQPVSLWDRNMFMFDLLVGSFVGMPSTEKYNSGFSYSPGC